MSRSSTGDAASFPLLVETDQICVPSAGLKPSTIPGDATTSCFFPLASIRIGELKLAGFASLRSHVTFPVVLSNACNMPC